MANSWIKYDTHLSRKAKVMAMSRQLGMDKYAVVGRLLEVWSWADANTVDGRADDVTGVDIDDLACCAKFSDAMVAVGWLLIDASGVSFPDYGVHNGPTGKARASSNRRMSEMRLRKCYVSRVTKASPEKRREEKKSINNTLSDCIYQAYPRHVGKPQAIKAIEKAILAIGDRANAPPDPGAWLLERVQVFAKSKAGNAGSYTPHPATWMNGGRYDDDESEWNRSGDSADRSPARISAPSGKYANVGRQVSSDLPGISKPQGASAAGAGPGPDPSRSANGDQRVRHGPGSLAADHPGSGRNGQDQGGALFG